MHTDYHVQFIQYTHENGISVHPRSFLRECFLNYRSGKGLRLSLKGIELIKTCSEYTWKEIQLPRYIGSREISKIDNYTKSPYYIEHRKLFISDEDMMIYYAMSNDFEHFLTII